MANRIHSALLIAAIVALVSVLGVTGAADKSAADKAEKFTVTGTVYCDVCRAKFVTRVSERMPAAKVRLECHNITDGKFTYGVDGETDANGVYHIEADGDHEDEYCGIKPVKSSKEDCSEIIKDGWAKEFTRVALTTKNGMVHRTRNVNPILYLKAKPIAVCAEVFKELHYVPGEDVHP
ncbi:olee1-like protein [Ipomoea triloba]|uniref:olee1-like protein n=1 Tax=Ipomoea triloba TaxID=35885 RepID=UPI00125E2040|nr:olee1-like protein [Ipomoea triloba]